MHGLLTRVRGCHFEVMPCSPKASEARPCDDDIDGKITVLKLGSRQGESKHISPLIARHKAVACTSTAHACPTTKIKFSGRCAELGQCLS